MSWETIGVLAEVIGALGVVITLMYLAIEVRHNRSATESASLDALTTGLNSINESLMNDPELSELYLIGMSQPEDLDKVQALRFIAMGQSYINHFTTVKKYHDSGLLKDEDWQSHLSAISDLMKTPGGHWLMKNIRVTPSVRLEIAAGSTEGRGELWGVLKNE